MTVTHSQLTFVEEGVYYLTLQYKNERYYLDESEEVRIDDEGFWLRNPEDECDFIPVPYLSCNL
jgi:hypothetical protein